MSQPTTRQHSLNELQPGSPGGRALASLRGPSYFKEIGSRGGRTTVQRHGLAHIRQLAAAGGREKRRRVYAWPRTVHPWYGGIERRVPFWPLRSTKRRKRPMFVYIEVQP
jgi:hypothetical protein